MDPQTPISNLDCRRVDRAQILDLRHAELRQGMPLEAAWFEGDDEPQTHHFGVFECDTGRNVGCASFMLSAWDGRAAWQLRGMATCSDRKGRGVGRRLLDFSIRHLMAEAGAEMFWCNARAHAAGFYLKMGWRIASDLFEIPTAGPHHKMIFDPAVDHLPTKR